MKKLAVLCLCAATLVAHDNYTLIEDQNSLQIVTPALAGRKTAKIRLTNGLEALLIHDPDVHESAAALAVEAGSWQDPKEYPGMAHFLEHMLFMGTAAYPKEEEYMQFIHENGGNVNAYTAPDRTVYGFSISNDAFGGALDRFSHFFIDPLFNPSSIGRELHAVDQEHGKNIEHDGWRSYMIMKETGNPNHPNAAFSTGNAATLSGIPQSALKTWYKEHYSANRMHLVAISSTPLDQMINLVVDQFSPVVNHQLEPPHYPIDVLSEAQLGHFLYIKPIKDLKSVSLIWQLPKEVALDYDSRTPQLICYALNNGTESGLLKQLQREKLAEHLAASIDNWSEECALLTIDISLTELGIQQLNTVIERTFQAIHRLKEGGVPRYVFDEMQKMATLRYEYQSRSDAFEFAMQEAANLMLEDLATYPQTLVVAKEYDAALIQKTVTHLTPASCLYVVLADPKLTGVETTQQEKWMNANYVIHPIGENRLVAWANVPLHPHLDIPQPNPYLPESVALLTPSAELPNTPTCIADEATGRLYFMQDTAYHVPETTALFALKTPQMNGSAKASVLFDLYTRAAHEKMSSTQFFASRAGLGLQLGQKDYSFTITTSGYSEKSPLYLHTVFQSLLEVLPTASEFEIYQASLSSSYDNASKELPFRQGLQIISTMIYNNSPTPEAKLAALKTISYEEFLAFSHDLFKEVYIEGMIYGNLSEVEAANIWAEIKSTLNAAPFPREQHYKKGVLLPSDKAGPYMVVKETPRQGNAVVLMLHEGTFTLERRAVQQILSSALQDDFFDTLRTKQQTGYIAKAWDIEVERQLLQFFTVQSMTHQPSELLARFELFLEDFSHNIYDRVSQTRFETLKASLVRDLAMPPETMVGRASQLQFLAFEHDADFDWIAKRVETVQAVTYDDFTKTTRQFLARSNLKRIAVLMQGVLPEKNQFRYEQLSQDDVSGIGHYTSFR